MPVAVLTDSERFPFDEEDKGRLACAGARLVEIPGHDTGSLAQIPGDADAVFVYSAIIDAPLLTRLRRCRVVARCGSGYDNIDVAAARARGIEVTYVPDYGSIDVAEHALALILACVRRIATGDQAVRLGHWPSYAELGAMRRLRGQALGLVGFGHIARELAALAHGLGLDVLAHDPHLPSAAFASHGVLGLELVELLAAADIVSLHVPLTQATRHIIGAGELRAMKPGAVLINTSRGGLVDQAALASALTEGNLGGAGIDVWDPEPPAAGDVLFTLPNIVVSPHTAAWTEEALAEVRKRALDDVLAVLSGGRPARPVPAPNAQS